MGAKVTKGGKFGKEKLGCEGSGGSGIPNVPGVPIVPEVSAVPIVPDVPEVSGVPEVATAICGSLTVWIELLSDANRFAFQ
ncbi:MAG: hypothetical protein DI535_24385 [Citrobacter freundii]|nr:MAG: hypothetical protein DI535_24385 [Citrobacter freundii]